MHKQRARSDEEKRARRDSILDAARRCFDGVQVEAFTMDAVAADLGLAKGTLYRYFPTRESLLLALTADEYEQWFDAVDARLAGDVTDDGASEVVAALVDETVARPRFTRLVAILASVLERNVPFETAIAFKAPLLQRTAVTAQLLGRRLGVEVAEARQLLVHLQASAIGLYHYANPCPVVADVLAAVEPAPMRIDLRRELTHATSALVAAARSTT